MNAETQMKTKLTPILIAVAVAAALTTASLVFSQTPSPSPSPTAAMQMEGMNQPGQMDQMATSVTQMAEMCKMMMKKEMATMHYKIAAGIAFAVVLFIDLLLLAVLEIQWIKYWSRVLKQLRSSSSRAS